ncbi:hypothetical protein Tco_1172821 [Tanacetum coccineum]
MEEEEVPLVDGVFEGALGALGDVDACFRNGSSSGCHGGLWWLIEDEEDGEVVICIWRELIRRKWSREVGMIWSFSVFRVCKSTKIPFVCEYGLTSEWDSEDLTELLERKSDEFVLNHERDKYDAEFILLKSELTIKV